MPAATDPFNCGRCGHSCLGGQCVDKKCKSVVVKGGLENPTDLVADANHVYVALYGSDRVVRIAKNGGLMDVLVSGHVDAHGVTLGGGKLFWANLDYAGTGTDGYWGGVWGCTLPACADTDQVTQGDNVAYVRFSNDHLFFTERSPGEALTWVTRDGVDKDNLAFPTDPWSVAVDESHVYFQFAGGLSRVSVAGGPIQPVGESQSFADNGFITLDADRVYWAFSDVGGSGETGRVYSALKSNLAAPIVKYGTNNARPNGVAVDATTLYWTNEGTLTSSTSNGDGKVLACPKQGCQGEPVVLEEGLVLPRTIVADGDALYFIVRGNGTTAGELRRLAKP